MVLGKSGDMITKEKLFVAYFLVCIWWNWSNSMHGAVIQACGHTVLTLGQ